MALQTAIVLSAAEVLDVELRGRMIDDFAEHPGPAHQGTADAGAFASLHQEHTIELDLRARLRVPVIHLDDLAFADSVLPGTVLENRVHGPRSVLSCDKWQR